MGTVELNNEINGSMAEFGVKSEIFDTLDINVMWDNAYNIGPEFGEIRFCHMETLPNIPFHIDPLQMSNSFPSTFSLHLTPRDSTTMQVIWKTGPKYKQLGTHGVPTPLGFITLIPHRSQSCLFRIPLQLHAILSHLTLSPGELFLPDFNFGRCFAFKITLVNNSETPMHVVARPSLLHDTPIDIQLRAHEKHVISLDLKLSARALHDDNSVQESIGFYSPENPINQASCLFSATVKNPLFLKLPDLDTTNSGNLSELELQPIALSMDKMDGFSVTPLRVRNLRDIDIAVRIQDLTENNHFSLQNEKGEIMDFAVIPQESEQILYLRYSCQNWLFQKPDIRIPLFRHIQNRFQIMGYTFPSKSESVTSPTEPMSAEQLHLQDAHNLFKFSVEYTGTVGIVKFSLSESVMKLQSRDSSFHNQSFEFKIQNENPGMKLPYKITVESMSSPEIKIFFSKREGIIDEQKYHYISFSLNSVTPGYRSFIIRVQHRDIPVYHDITVLLFTTNPSLLLSTRNSPHNSSGSVSTVSLGAISVSKKTPSSSFYMTSDIPSDKTVLWLQNVSSDRLCVVPFSDLPISLSPYFPASSSYIDSPSLSGRDSDSLRDIPPFSLEHTSIPTCLETQFGYTKSGDSIEIPANQVVELDITVKPREIIPIDQSIDLEDEKYNGEYEFSGDICCFNSRGDNYFQQIVGVTGKYYVEKVEISCQTPEFGDIFVNSSRHPRLDIRIDNNSCASVQVDLSRLPLGFIPAVVYTFSRNGGSLPMLPQQIKNETPIVEVDECCYVTLTVELDMKQVDWKVGKNFWNLEFCTLRTPQHVMTVDVSAMVYPSALEVRNMENSIIEDIQWDSVEFPSKSDLIYQIQLVNVYTESIRVIPSFYQSNFSHVFSIIVDETPIELPKSSTVMLEIKLHAITINSLDSKQMADLMRMNILAGKLQLLVDIQRRQFQQNVLRTVVETPVHVHLQFKQFITVFPPILSIFTVVEHYSKIEDLLESHFEESPHAVYSDDSEIESNFGSGVSSPVVDISSELEGTECEAPHHELCSLNSNCVICHLVQNTIQIQIQNLWRERIQVKLCSTKLKHKKHGILYSGSETPVFESLIELPEMIVIDPESTVSVLATLIPDHETPV